MAAWGNFGLDKGFKAAAAVTKFRAVKGTGTDGEVTPVTADTDIVIGIAQYSVSAGELAKKKDASVRLTGISEMEAGGTIQQGALVCITATGLAVTGTAGDRCIGTALADASSGNRLPVFLGLPGFIHP